MRVRRYSVLLAAAILLAACDERPQRRSVAHPERIVSMAPSLTETLLALDLSDRLVGITRYCPNVEGAVVVGGYFDPSFETIVALDPDLVVIMQSHDELDRRLEDLGLKTLQVDQHDVEGILSSIEVIAASCGTAQRGRRLTDSLRGEMDEVAAKVAGRPRPSALVVVGREPGDARIGGVWAAGEDTFYDDVLRLAGGVNAMSGTSIRYPELGREGLLAVNPDVVFDIVADGGARGVTVELAVADWEAVGGLDAVRNGRVHVLMDDFVVIPGPRVVDTVRTFARLLHPEVEWGD